MFVTVIKYINTYINNIYTINDINLNLSIHLLCVNICISVCGSLDTSIL